MPTLDANADHARASGRHDRFEGVVEMFVMELETGVQRCAGDDELGMEQNITELAKHHS